MQAPDLAEFTRAAKAAGYDEVLERQWAPDTTIATHTHAFDAHALVTQGEMWLQSPQGTQHITPGGRFTLPAHTPHAERYGSAGAVYWVARRAV